MATGSSTADFAAFRRVLDLVPDWFVVKSCRAIYGDAAGSSDPEGIAIARQALIDIGEQSGNQKQFTLQILSKVHEGRRWCNDWKGRYPQASDAAAELMMQLESDMPVEQSADKDYQVHLYFEPDGSEIMMFQTWLKTDDNEALPMLVFKTMVGSGFGEFLLNRDRQHDARSAFSDVIKNGYMYMMATNSRETSFSIDVQDFCLRNLRAREPRADAGIFGRAVYES